MNLQTIKKLGTIVVPKKSSLSILENFKIENGHLSMTDLDIWVSIKNVDAPDGIYNFPLFSKSLSFVGAFTERQTGDFPGAPDTFNTALCSDVFNQIELLPFLDHVSTDISRVALVGVYAGLKGVAATNGHTLMYDSSLTIEEELILPPEFVKVLAVLQSTGAFFTKTLCSDRYIRLESEHFTVISKLLDGPYPDFQKCIPETSVQTSISLSTEQIGMYRDAIKTLLPYTNFKTRCVRVYGNKIKVVNREADKFLYAQLPFDVTPEKVKHIEYVGDVMLCTESPIEYGFNAEYFLDILKKMGTDFIIGYGNSGSLHNRQSIQATTYRNDKGVTFLLMPVQIIEEEPLGDGCFTKIEVMQSTARKQKPKISNKLQSIIEKAVEKHGEKTIIDLLEVL